MHKSRVFNIVRQTSVYWLNYIIRFRGDKINYLRWLGARIGNNCSILNRIGEFSEPWLIEIGNNVTITAGVLLVTHDGGSRIFRNELPGANRVFGNSFGTIIVHDNSFIGINSIILPGIVIGPNSVVGAGSVVTKNIPPGYVYAGNPAHKICTFDEYKSKYIHAMLPIKSQDRNSLRKELTEMLWGEYR